MNLIKAESDITDLTDNILSSHMTCKIRAALFSVNEYVD